MKRLLPIVALLVLSACSGGKDAVDQSAGGQFRFASGTVKGSVITAADRKSVGDVHGDLLTGGQYTLSSDKGKVVVINFWGSWCGPCQSETPAFDRIFRAVRSEGVNFVGMAVKENSTGDTSAFVRDNDISFPIVYDARAKTALQLGNVPAGAGLPLTVLVDKQQRVAAVYIGVVQPADLRPALAELIAEK